MIKIVRRISWLSIRFATIVVACFAMNGCAEQPPELDDAGTHFLNAKDAIDAGDDATAIDELTKSITVREDAWSYFERAQLYAKAGEDEKAKADVKIGLSIDPSNKQLIWLQKEMKRPKKQRFKQALNPNAVGK